MLFSFVFKLFVQNGHANLDPAVMVARVWIIVGVIAVLVLKDGQARTAGKTSVSDGFFRQTSNVKPQKTTCADHVKPRQREI
jgi:hypothetical protein